MAAPFVGIDQHLVGDDVELLLDFALDVLALGAAHDFAQSALVDLNRDALAGARDDFDQQTQFGRDEAVFTLLFDQIAGQGDLVAHVGGFPGGGQSASARVMTSRTSLLSSALAATRAMASRAALR